MLDYPSGVRAARRAHGTNSRWPIARGHGAPRVGPPLGDRRPGEGHDDRPRSLRGPAAPLGNPSRGDTGATLCYKVIDLSPQSDAWPADMEDVLNEQAQEGWELVTGFERTHEALQVRSTIGPVPGLGQHRAGVQKG